MLEERTKFSVIKASPTNKDAASSGVQAGAFAVPAKLSSGGQQLDTANMASLCSANGG